VTVRFYGHDATGYCLPCLLVNPDTVRQVLHEFMMYKVVRLSDPRQFEQVLAFLCPEDIPHRIDPSADDICKMHEEDADKVQHMPVRKCTRFRVTAFRESQSLSLLTLLRQLPIRGGFGGARWGGAG